MEGILSRDEFADRPVPDYILQYLAKELAEEWQTLARYLNISDADLHNIKADNSGHMQDTKYIMLRHWSKRNGTGATYRVLATALDKASRRDLREYVESQDKEKDLIKYLELAYRKRYETAKPFPSMSKCSVDSIFVEGGIYYSAHEGDSMQKPDVLESLKSYNDILSCPKTQSKRTIIEGDPGYGKSTLTLQYLYDWCTKNPTSPLKDVKILIYLQLRHLAGVKSIYTAIKHSIVPKDEDMDEACIKEILKAYKKSVVMIFDSYDEYPDKNETESDISSIIEMKMFLDILVIILTRTLNLPRNLHPETKRIRLTGFGVVERQNYVLKAVANDVQLADRIEKQLQRNPFLSDLCQVPLFSTMVAHIAHERPEIKIFSTVTIFFTYVIKCLHNHMKNKKGANTEMPAFETELAKLYSIAFDGLTQNNQQLSWEKTYLVSELGQEFYDNYINLGMLAQKRVFDISQCRIKTEARTWHKILCEFYASHHLVWILSVGASSSASSINVKETLNSINPLDLQYVFRFACGLNKSAADIIIKHLRETTEGRQCAILCMLEQEADSDQYLQSVKDLVSCTIIIHTDNAKLSQRSTIQVLEVASANQIPISCVHLSSCSPRVDESGLNLILQSGLALPILSSLQKLVISDIDRRLTNKECAAILSYSSQCTSLKELSLVSYNLPNTIPVGSIPSSLKSRNVKVWNNKARDISHLNLQTGRWQGTYPWLIGALSVLLSNNDCQQLAHHVALPKYQLDAIINSKSPAKDLLDVLEERGVIHTSNVSRLLEAIKILKINETALLMLERYQRSRGDETSYGRFLAELSSHLTLSLPRKLCDYFEFTNEKKKAVITSQTPGISFLLTLEDMGVINPFDVRKLVTPLKQYQLVQAVAKVQEYQTLVDERSELTKPIHTLEGKQALFIECLRKKTKSWYETMTPLPWKKSCKWMTSELFIACGLVLTDSKSKMKTTDVDEECKLKYTDILTHRRLKSATRIIIEGDPGSGKTMLSSQLAYDWSIGKSSDARMVVFLPLKFVDGMTIIEAIKQLYVPKGKPLNEGDIKAILDQASDENKTCIVLDGLEEYNGRTNDGEPSEVERVMRKEKFPNCTVVLTSRSDFVHDLPQCPMLKLGRFGEEERDQYIANIIPDDRERQQKVKCSIETSALLFDLCSNPLLFVYIVHNIEHLGQIDKPKGQLDSVGPFIEVMVNTLLSLSRSEHSESSEGEIMSKRLSEIAFNGLCKGYQQLMWQKRFLNENVSNVKDWIESGILVVEEGVMAREEEQRNKEEAVEEGMVTQDEIISIEDERREGESSSEAAMIVEGQDDILSIDEENPSDRRSSSDNMLNEKEKPFTEMKTSTGPQNLSLQVKSLHKVIQERFADNDRRQGESSSKAAMIGEGQDDILSIDMENPSDRESSSDNKPKETEKPFTERKTTTDLQNLSLQVKFLHKVIQEWFAAKHFSSMLQWSKGKNRHRSFLNKHLPLINPADLHYVLRFTSYLCPENCYLIMEHLHSCYKSPKGVVPEYILNCIFLCFIECNTSVRNKRMDNPIRQVCKNIVTIRGGDSRILQQSKVSMLMYAANSKIRIGSLRLVDLIVEVTKETLTFNSNITLECFPTLKVIEVSRWDMRLKVEDFEELIKFITQCKLLNKAFLNFPSPPPSLTDKTLLSSMKKNLTIEWIIGDRIVHTLDKKSGEWPMQFRSTPHQTTDFSQPGPSESSAHLGKRKKAKERMSTPKSVQKQDTEEPDSMTTKKKHVNTGSQQIVQTLQITKASQIFTQGETACSEPQWEEQSNTHYELGEHNRVIDIQRFSWEKFVVLDKIVEAKNIIVYAAGRCGPTDTMYLDIGYYWDLARCEEVSKLNNAKLLHKEPTVFYNDGKHLQISLTKFTPMNWTCSRGEKGTQAISFDEVAIASWSFRTFVLDKTEPKGTDACTCYCKAGQAPNQRNFIFQLKAPDPPSVKQPSTSKRQVAVKVERSTAGIEAPDRVVTTDTIQDLYTKFCREWKTVGRKLNIGEPKLQAIDKDNQNARGKVYQMLLTWKQSKGNKASYRLLGDAFEAAGLQDLQQFLYKQACDHHYEQRYGDNSQEGRRSIEEPIHQNERPSEEERTQRKLHFGNLGDQQIKIGNRNEDRERSSRKFDLKQKHLDARERKRVSVTQGGGQSKSIIESRESASAGRGREQSKFSLTTERKSISLKRVKHKLFEDTESKSVSPKRAKHIRFSDGEPPEEHQVEDSHPSSSASDVENTHNRE